MQQTTTNDHHSALLSNLYSVLKGRYLEELHQPRPSASTLQSLEDTLLELEYLLGW